MDRAVQNNKKLSRFEMVFEDGKVALLEYRWKKGDMLLMRTYVPAEHRLKGIGAELTKAALEYAKEQNLKVQVFCPFVELYIKKNVDEYGMLVSAP
jgi:predicted GNAT family acetyltransferase